MRSIPQDPDPSETVAALAHCDACRDLLTRCSRKASRGPGATANIESLTELAAAGPLQAEGVVDLGRRSPASLSRLAPSSARSPWHRSSDALREAIGFDLVVFAGFAVSADAQDKLGVGKIGGTHVSLLLANPDLLVGDLLKNTTTSQTFRLYSAPDVQIEPDGGGYRVTVAGVDTFDAATGESRVVREGRDPGLVP